MPRGLSSDQSASKSTEDISRQLQELNLIRGSKNIDQISDKDKQEPAAKTSSNNDDNDDDASDNDVVSDKDKEVCVQKVMQVRGWLEMKLKLMSDYNQDILKGRSS